MEVKLGQTIDYGISDMESSSYSHMKLVPLSGAQTGAEGETITFELPIQAINLSRSYLQMRVEVAAPMTATKRNWVHRGILPISAMQLFTRGGQYLCNIQERLSDYSRVVMSADTHREELDNGDESTTVYRTGDGQFYGPENAIADIVKDAPYFSQQVMDYGAVNTARNIDIKFPLSLLKHTIFSINKSILFREVLVLKIRLADKGDVGFAASTDANFSPALAPEELSNVTYSNICMYVSQERNSNIVESLNVATESEQGFNLLVPFPTLFTNIRNSTYQAVSLRLNKSHGSSLKAVKHTVFTNGALNLRYNRANVDGDIVKKYYVNINNNRLTEFDIDCQAGQYLDYQEQKKRLMDTPARNRIIYQRNWFHEDRFDDYQDKKTDLKTCDTNIMSGIDLNQEIRYDFYGTETANAQHRHFSIVQGQKLLNINRNGLVLG